MAKIEVLVEFIHFAPACDYDSGDGRRRRNCQSAAGWWSLAIAASSHSAMTTAKPTCWEAEARYESVRVNHGD
jgi:hypothetical protein